MKETSQQITGHLNALTYDLRFSISIRDLFAAAAFGAIIQARYPHASSYKEQAAREAYEFADAALTVRAELEDLESTAELNAVTLDQQQESK